MKHYLIITAGLMAFFLVFFLAVEALGLPILTDPGPWMNSGGITAAIAGVGLLISDVLLPVPSSLIMIANGALFGTWMGMLLSLIGSTGAALFGFAIGRRGGAALDKLVTPEESARANALIEKWGVLAIVVTRPVPIFAETTAIIAGTSSIGWGTMTLASLAGSIPAAVLYALAGAAVADMRSATVVFGFVLLIAALIALATGIWRWYAKTRDRSGKRTAVN